MSLEECSIRIDTSDFYNEIDLKYTFFKENKAMIAAYLTFNGNTEEAFNFYRSVLGGEFTNFQRFGDSPPGEGMSEKDRKKIMHITLDTPQGIIMGSDHMDFTGEPFNAGNNFSLSIHPSSEEETTRLFNGLSNAGKVTMPLEKVFWGAYFGMLTDKFGIKWLLNYQYDKQ